MKPIVKMEGIVKRFPGVVALDGIAFDVVEGEVHILLGENGAGKSTLMKILSGAYTPDEGKIYIDGDEVDKLTPKESADRGISIIYQELSVIDELSIQENIFMGRMIKKQFGAFSMIDNEAMRKRTQELLESIDLHKSPSTKVGSLSISEKQMVEIAKAVAFNAKVIVMDEPTSSLTTEEINKLFQIIDKLKKEKKGVIFISHKLPELMQIGDRVTVLKDGTYVGTKNISEVTPEILISMMVGRELQDKYTSQSSSFKGEETIFEVKDITRKDDYVRNINFKLKKGEVLGFAGLIGAGRSETMSAIYGAAPIKSGEIFLHGEKIKIKSPYNALKQGVGLVTENRRETGFFKNFSIKRNISISRQLLKSKLGGLWGIIDSDEENQIAQHQKKELQIKCTDVNQNITTLSGGNQQKVILGKWLASDLKILIFDEPTKGIDVGTKAEIYKLMRKLADEGIGVIVISSELPELLAVCDRIIVMSGGSIVAEVNAEDASEEGLIAAATNTTFGASTMDAVATKSNLLM